jgi:hypothetical protein
MSVLGQQASHLILIRTDLGHGTALTAACARQGCSATDSVGPIYNSVVVYTHASRQYPDCTAEEF